MKEKIEQLVGGALGKIAGDVDVSNVRIMIERPKDVSHGDWTTNVAFIAAKKLSKSPMDIAVSLAEELNVVDDKNFDAIKAVGGYVNFTYTESQYVNIVENEDVKNVNLLEMRKGQKVVVEYTQPNPFKPFHIGHLMSNTIGESLARLTEVVGADVVRANYQGDVGPHVAKALWALREWKEDASDIAMIGKAYAHGHAMSEENESAKTEIARINKAVYENSDPEVMSLYEQGKKTTLDRFAEIYGVLGTKFDYLYFESQVWEEGKRIVLENVGIIFEESEGAIIFPGEKYNLHTRVFITKEGLPTYEAKEIGLAAKKHADNAADEYVIDTAVEQASYFSVVKKAIELLYPDLEGKITHIAHGMMQLSDGKMSSRKGNVVTGESLIEEARTLAGAKVTERAGETSQELIDHIAVAGIKFSILKQATGKNIVYDQDAALSFEGDSGPYLQYTHARCASIVRSSEIKAKSVLFDKRSTEVVRLLDQYEEMIALAAKNYAPHILANYLLELAHTYNTFYAAHRIIDETPESGYRVLLTKSVGVVLERGLYLLGIHAPQKM